MKCTDILNTLEDFLDDELSETSKKDVESHLKDCSPCQSQFQSLKKLSSLLHFLPQPNPPQKLEALILEKIQKKRSFRLITWAPPFLAAAGLFLSLTFLSTQFLSGASQNRKSSDSNSLEASRRSKLPQSAQLKLEETSSNNSPKENVEIEKKADSKRPSYPENIRNKATLSEANIEKEKGCQDEMSLNKIAPTPFSSGATFNQTRQQELDLTKSKKAES
ncbi:MAG: anti-sigma factor [Planctomycetota bacterium]